MKVFLQVTRYFQTEDDVDEHKNSSIKENRKRKVPTKVISYNIDVKPGVWGRRHQDKIAKAVSKPNTPGKYPKKKPIPKELLEKHSRGEGLNVKGVRTRVHKKKHEQKERNIQFANELAARAEILLTEESG